MTLSTTIRPKASAEAEAERSPAQAETQAREGCAVYVHWPFCLSKCPYCDFNSHVAPQGAQNIDHDRFERALRAELSHMARLMPGRAVSSLFFGGGTPSLMQPQTVAAIIAHVDRLWGLEPGAEITLEANPTSAEADRFAALQSAGVNRLSLGIQALEDSALKRLGRTHTAAGALRALDMAARHFARLSFDLIYARPGQSPQDWRQELGWALDLACGHLSLYQLTIEPGTPFARWHRQGRLVLPSDDMAVAFYMLTQEMCAERGYRAYEVSNHATAGQQCRHNLTYWRYGTFVGVGPGAHGRLKTPVAGHGVPGCERVATQTVRDPARWLAQVEEKGHGLAEAEPVAPREQIEEILLMGLRLSEGVALDRLEALGWQVPYQTIKTLSDERLVQHDVSGNRLALTARGRMVLNSVIAGLVLAGTPEQGEGP